MSLCNPDTLIIDETDFNNIAQVSLSCNYSTLSIYILEQQELYLLDKIGYCLYSKIIDGIQNDNLSDELKNLLCGGEFIGCGGQKEYSFGIKKVLVHRSYGAYVYRHGQIDTPIGLVQKLNNDSIPIPTSELKQVMNEHFTSADMYWESVKKYIHAKKDIEPYKECFINNSCSCSEYYNDCSYCNGNGYENKNNKNRSINFEVINR